MKRKPACKHIEALDEIIQPQERVCEECIKTGDSWVQLRTCQSCGKTLCCDSSPNKHMTQHFHETDHPVIISAQPEDRWIWCYKDEVYDKY